jgi:hypothetical protein
MSTNSIKDKDNFNLQTNLDPDDNLVLEYISQFGEKEKKAYEIAKDHLGTSFNIKKSIGFKEWKKEKK